VCRREEQSGDRLGENRRGRWELRERVGKKGQNKLLVRGAMGFSRRERERVKVVREGMRK
jgi:hypothetical protein